MVNNNGCGGDLFEKKHAQQTDIILQDQMATLQRSEREGRRAPTREDI